MHSLHVRHACQHAHHNCAKGVTQHHWLVDKPPCFCASPPTATCKDDSTCSNAHTAYAHSRSCTHTAQHSTAAQQHRSALPGTARNPVPLLRAQHSTAQLSAADHHTVHHSQVLNIAQALHLLLVGKAPGEHALQVGYQVLPAASLGHHRHAPLNVPLEQHLHRARTAAPGATTTSACRPPSRTCTLGPHPCRHGCPLLPDSVGCDPLRHFVSNDLMVAGYQSTQAHPGAQRPRPAQDRRGSSEPRPAL